jgi:hypothetical protein
LQAPSLGKEIHMVDTPYSTGDLDAATKRLRDEASAIGQDALDAIDSGRAAAARGVRGTADVLRSAADALPGAPRVREFADGAARMFDGTAKYLRDRQPKDMLDDFHAQAKANPVAFLIGALAVGFLAGRMLRRS